jgi:hypothetical protein
MTTPERLGKYGQDKENMAVVALPKPCASPTGQKVAPLLSGPIYPPAGGVIASGHEGGWLLCNCRALAEHQGDYFLPQGAGPGW